MLEEVIPSIGAVALQEQGLGTTDLPAVSSENGKDSISWGIVAMPPRDQLLLSNVLAMFDLTCLARVGQISNAKPYRNKLAKIVVPGLMGSTRTLDKLIELTDRFMVSINVRQQILLVDAITLAPPCNLAPDLQFLASGHSIFMFVNAMIMGLTNHLSWSPSWVKWLLDDTDKGFMARTEEFSRYLVFKADLSNVSKVRFHSVGKDRHGQMHVSKHHLVLFVSPCARSIMDVRNLHEAHFAVVGNYTCGYS